MGIILYVIIFFAHSRSSKMTVVTLVFDYAQADIDRGLPWRTMDASARGKLFM